MITVFYEDKQERRRLFGLHHFVCQLVIDASGIVSDPYTLGKECVFGIPLKGDSNIFSRCKSDLHRLASRNRKVFAVYDQDKIHRLLKMDASSCRTMFREKLLQECSLPELLEIVFINSNVESVLETIRDFRPAIIGNQNTMLAALRKELQARDSVFIQCAENTDKNTRAALLAQRPDLARLVRKISEVLQASPT